MFHSDRVCFSRARLSALLLMTSVILGCGSPTEKTYSVEGKVVWGDGQPAAELAGGTVELQLIDQAARKVSPHGEIQSDGSFTLRSYESSDGAPAGKYRALVVPKKSMDAEDAEDPCVMDPRFEQYDSSGLEVTIIPEDNQITLRIQRAGRE